MKISDDLKFDFKYNSLFSEYLPPSFSIMPTNSLDIYSISIKEKIDSVEPYTFTMSNFSENDKRRTLYLPELVSYVKLITYMLEENLINELCELSSNDLHSFSQVIQIRNGEMDFIKHESDYGAYDDEDKSLLESAVDDPSNYTDNIVDKLNRAKGAKGILYLDIANCYKSVYTHYLTSIKLGIEGAKAQYKLSKSDKSLLHEDYKKYMQLDSYVRGLNLNESSGILTGPRVSNYIVESFLSRIDVDIEEAIEKDMEIEFTDFVRYVDDYEFFIYDEKDKERIISIVESIFNNYRLTINDSKTKYHDFPYYVVKNLNRLYNRYIANDEVPTEDLIEVFNEYFLLEKDGTKGAIRYLIKSIPKEVLFENEKLYTTYLINILVNDKRSLVKVCQLMIRDKEKLELDEEHFMLIERLLLQSIRSNLDVECAWLLYLLKRLDYSDISRQVVEELLKSSNELSMIILLEEYELSLAQIKAIADKASSWLLLYQLFLRNQISDTILKNRTTISKNMPFYRTLKRNHFSFYRI